MKRIKASEYIKLLQELIDAHGDLDVVDDEGEPVTPPRFDAGVDDEGAVIEELGGPAFVLCQIGYMR